MTKIFYIGSDKILQWSFFLGLCIFQIASSAKLYFSLNDDNFSIERVRQNLPSLSIDLVDDDGNTLLHDLVKVCRRNIRNVPIRGIEEHYQQKEFILEIAKAIFELIFDNFPKINVNARNKKGFTVLDMAANHSSTGHLIPTLIKRGRFEEVKYAFSKAIYFGLDLIRDPSFAGNKFVNGAYPLTLAVKQFRITLIEELLRRSDVDVDAVDDGGNTALHHLIKQSGGKLHASNVSLTTRIITLFYKRGINVNIRNKDDHSILDLAAERPTTKRLVNVILAKRFDNVSQAVTLAIISFNHSYLSALLKQYPIDVANLVVFGMSPLNYILSTLPITKDQARTIAIFLAVKNMNLNNVRGCKSYYQFFYESQLCTPYARCLLGPRAQELPNELSWEQIRFLLEASHYADSMGWMIEVLRWIERRVAKDSLSLENVKKSDNVEFPKLVTFQKFLKNLIETWQSTERDVKDRHELAKCMKIFDETKCMKSIAGRILKLEKYIGTENFIFLAGRELTFSFIVEYLGADPSKLALNPLLFPHLIDACAEALRLTQQETKRKLELEQHARWYANLADSHEVQRQEHLQEEKVRFERYLQQRERDSEEEALRKKQSATRCAQEQRENARWLGNLLSKHQAEIIEHEAQINLLNNR